MEAEQPQNRRVGRYRLVERLAVGGMAEVFLALERGDTSPGGLIGGLERLVVIKRILPHLAEEPAFVEMFMAEARIVARIQHPNVVQIFELGESGGLPFIAMEYVNGSTLKQLVSASRHAEVRLPTSAVMHLVSQSCAGAHAAHELKDPSGKPYGLVHRDISPHNLMVDDQGHVKLLDFGIAKADGMDQTRTGLLKGKISYMSPEQCKQEKLDRRSDVFALGVVAWEMLAGQRPFHGASELATMQAIVTGDLPDLRARRPDVPPGVVTVIERSLAVRREDRQGSAELFREELRDAVRGTEHMPDADATARLVRTLLGDRHERRQVAVEQAMERTLVSLSGVAPVASGVDASASSRSLSVQISSEAVENTSSRPSGTGAHRAVQMGGVLASVGALVGLGGLVVAVIALAVVAYTFWPEADPNLPPPPPDGEPILVSLAPVLAPDELAREHEPIRRYLERTLDRPVVFRVEPSYDRAAREVVEGSVPFAFLPQRTTRAAADQAELQLLAVKVVDGSTSTDGYLLVPRDGKITTAGDIGPGTVICYSDPLSNTGYRLPRAWLTSQGVDLDVLTERISGNHHQVLVDLVEGRCDLGGTHSGNYNTAGPRGVPVAQLKLLAITGSTPHDAFVAGPAATDEEAEALAAALLAFDPQRDAGVPQVGESERITGFAKPPDDYLEVGDEL